MVRHLRECVLFERLLAQRLGDGARRDLVRGGERRHCLVAALGREQRAASREHRDRLREAPRPRRVAGVTRSRAEVAGGGVVPVAQVLDLCQLQQRLRIACRTVPIPRGALGVLQVAGPAPQILALVLRIRDRDLLDGTGPPVAELEPRDAGQDGFRPPCSARHPMAGDRLECLRHPRESGPRLTGDDQVASQRRLRAPAPATERLQVAVGGKVRRVGDRHTSAVTAEADRDVQRGQRSAERERRAGAVLVVERIDPGREDAARRFREVPQARGGARGVGVPVRLLEVQHERRQRGGRRRHPAQRVFLSPRGLLGLPETGQRAGDAELQFWVGIETRGTLVARERLVVVAPCRERRQRGLGEREPQIRVGLAAPAGGRAREVTLQGPERLERDRRLVALRLVLAEQP